MSPELNYWPSSIGRSVFEFEQPVRIRTDEEASG